MTLDKRLKKLEARIHASTENDAFLREYESCQIPTPEMEIKALMIGIKRCGGLEKALNQLQEVELREKHGKTGCRD